MTRLWQTGMAILAAVILVCGGADALLAKDAGQDSAKKGSAQESKAALPVKAVQVKKTSQERHLDYPGVVLADNQSRLSFRVSGMIEEIPVKVGQVMKEGQLIARLDETHFLNAKEQALAAKRQAEARMLDARSEYQRLRKLLSARDISKSRLQSAQTSAKSAEEELRIAQKRLSEAERQLGYASLKAPFAGIIASKEVHAYQGIEAGQPVALLVDLSDLLFRAQLPASILPQKRYFKGFKCRFPTLGGLELGAKLHGIGPSALPPLRTFPLTVELESTAKHPVRPGAEGVLSIVVSSKATKDQILVPVSAITSDHQANPKVWIADPKTGQAQQQAVKLGGVHNGKMAVKSGIKPGQWVITAGQSHLSAGQKVKIVKSKADSQ